MIDPESLVDPDGGTPPTIILVGAGIVIGLFLGGLAGWYCG